MAADNLISPSDLATYSGPPLFLFVGISTAGSSIHRMFPRWAPAFNPEARVLGVDLPPDAPAEVFRRLVGDMGVNPDIRGAVVTSHKVRLFASCSDLFDFTSPLVDIAHEVNSISSSGGLHAFATDPIALDAVIGEVRPRAVDPAPIVCLGSGGSAAALALTHLLDIEQTLSVGRVVPRRAVDGALTIVARRASALPELEELLSRLPESDRIQLTVAVDSRERTSLTASQPAGSLVINATGLGKTEAGSPVDGAHAFPAGAVAWDFNYRGPLTFLEQAREAGVRTEDGWDYFLAGWSTALAAIEGRPTEAVLAAVREASSGVRSVGTGAGKREGTDPY